MGKKMGVPLLCMMCLFSSCSMTVHATAGEKIESDNMPAIQQALRQNTMSKEEYNEFFYQLEKKSDEKKVQAGYAYVRQSYPTRYDPRTLDMVTSVKDQSPYGTCWSFGAIAAAESALIKQELEDKSIDLSELQYVYHYWQEQYSSKSYQYAFDEGAPLFQAWEYMIDGVGPACESKFGSIEDYNGETFTEEEVYSRLYDLDHMEYASYEGTDYTPIKKLITQYGGVATAYYADEKNAYVLSNPVSASDDDYNNTGDCTYYNPFGNSDEINHMVEIVGWDDDYPATNFVSEPEGNGAWLVKNSWGEHYYGTWDDQKAEYFETTGKTQAEPTGYYWISYYEKSIQDVMAVAVSFTEKDTKAKELVVGQSAYDLYVGDTAVIQAQILPETASNKDISCVSRSEDVATVDENGVITATGAGTTVIDVKSLDIIDVVEQESNVPAKQITVKVTKPTITIQEGFVTLKKGQTYRLSPSVKPEGRLVEYTTSNPEVVNVSADGVLTAMSVGSGIVTMTVQNSTVYKSINIFVTEDTSENLTTENPTTENNPVEKPTTEGETTGNNTTENVTAESNVSVNPVTTKRVTVKTPQIKKASSSGKKYSIRWKKMTGISGYRIQYSADKNFKKKRSIRLSAAKSGFTFKWTSKKRCYVRIQAYRDMDDKRYYSKWKKKTMK